MTIHDAIPRDEVLVTLFLAAGGRLEDVLPPRWLAELASVVAYSAAVFEATTGRRRGPTPPNSSPGPGSTSKNGSCGTSPGP